MQTSAEDISLALWAFALPLVLAGMMFGVLLMALTQRLSQLCPGCKVGARDFIFTGIGIGSAVAGALIAIRLGDRLAGMAWGVSFLWAAGWLMHDLRLYRQSRQLKCLFCDQAPKPGCFTCDAHTPPVSCDKPNCLSEHDRWFP